MSTIVFVHGLANGPADRRRIVGNLHKKWADSSAYRRDDQFRVAQWRSRGTWSMDLADLGHPDGIRAAEAVQDIDDEIEAFVDSDPLDLLIGHSMGQVLTRLVANKRPPRALITVGGPLGNPALRQGLYLQPWARRVEEPYKGIWVDVWNRQDPVCAEYLLGHQKPVGVTRSVQVDAPGTPTVFDPLAEHGAYFDLPAFWAVVAETLKELP